MEFDCSPLGVVQGLGKPNDGAGLGVKCAGTGFGACIEIGLCEGPGDTERSLKVLCKAEVPANNPVAAACEFLLCEGPGDTERSGMALRSAASCDLRCVFLGEADLARAGAAVRLSATFFVCCSVPR